METKLGSEVQVGDVFHVNGDKFEIISIEVSRYNPDSRKVRFRSLSTGREYVRLLWNNDSLVVA